MPAPPAQPEPASAAKGPLASLAGVSKAFGTTRALDDVELQVQRGEVLGLLGPNGAGKTTAVRILCGLLPPDAGRATVDGLDVQVHPLEVRRRYSLVPSDAPLYAQLSAHAHLNLVGRLHELDDATIAERSERLLGGFELTDRADDPVGGFSRGMRQKIAIACALLPEPPLLVLDEPLSGLDAPSAMAIKEVLRRWAERGGAVLYTSHLLDVVERVADRIVILASGRVAAEGTLAELRARTGEDGTLERVFEAVTHSADPSAVADRLLGPRPRA
jgi:ABC-2 type transport system ATP-binding protein